MKSSVLAVLAVCFALFAMSAADAQEEEWEYEIIPYLWASDLDGREGVGDVIIDVEASFDNLLEFVNVGAAMRMEARREPVAWFAEASYIELENTSATPLGTVRAELAQTYAEGGVAYELNAQLALYGGLRYQKLDTELAGPLGFRRRDQSWVDAIAGARWTPIRSQTWLAWVRADAGAGGSDLVWLAEAGGGYRFGTTFGVYLAYRLLDTDYNHEGFLYDIQQSGFAIGFGLRF